MFENRVLRKIHNEELNDLYSSPNVIQVIKEEKNEMGGACSAYGGKEKCEKGFGGETWRKETTWKTQSQMGG